MYKKYMKTQQTIMIREKYISRKTKQKDRNKIHKYQCITSQRFHYSISSEWANQRLMDQRGIQTQNRGIETFY